MRTLSYKKKYLCFPKNHEQDICWLDIVPTGLVLALNSLPRIEGFVFKDTRSRYEEELNGMLEAAKGLIENIKEWREAILTNVDLRAAEFAAKEAKRTMGLS